jgi:hypothetical protein
VSRQSVTRRTRNLVIALLEDDNMDGKKENVTRMYILNRRILQVNITAVNADLLYCT